MKLQSPLSFSNLIQPICVSKGIDTNKMGYVTGWGRVSATGGKSRILKQASVKIIAQNSHCIYYMSQLKENWRVPMHRTHICGGFDRQNSNACRADSGGPLVSYR